jgi:hypothetical protein
MKLTLMQKKMKSYLNVIFKQSRFPVGSMAVVADWLVGWFYGV